jgi:S1-C subfamily serine protease
MKPSRSFIVFCALLVATFCKGQTQPNSSTPERSDKNATTLPFEDARRMTVLVRIKGTTTASNIGSAVWIGKSGYLATCYHVVKAANAPLRVGLVHDPIFSGGFVVAGASELYSVDVVAFDETTDVAILKAAKLPGHPPGVVVPGVKDVRWLPKGAILSTSALTPGQSVLLAGYPLNQTTLILQTGMFTGEGFFPATPVPSRSPSTNGRRLMLSLVSNPGNSGGPVFDADGTVVGLLQGNLTSPMRDLADTQNLICIHAKLDPAGNVLKDAAGNPVPEPTPCVQNSGISIAVPAQFILNLAKAKGLDIN